MNIYIIVQHLNHLDQGEDRFLKLGRELSSRGHNVTVITTKDSVDLDLGKKKIGLIQKNGLKVIAFNVEDDRQYGPLKKIYTYLKFARMSRTQGHRLPKPNLIIAASPPLTAVWPALKLGQFYQVPVVIDIRELWPDGPVQRGSLKNKLLIRVFKGLEQKAYQQASRIIVSGKNIAEMVKLRVADQAKIKIVSNKSDNRTLIEQFEHALEEFKV